MTEVLYGLTDRRGPENAEQQAEIEGLAAQSRLPLKFVQGIQMLYELQTLMPPIVNVSAEERATRYPAGYEALSRLPSWGCTGIIAVDSSDGTVNHARNLDFAPVDTMTHLVYTGIFTRGGKEIFRSQMVAGYTMVITGMRKGPDGFAIERNTRYPDHDHGNTEMLQNILNGRPLNGWTLRKILENEATFEKATAAIAATPFVSTEYSIVSGVRKGHIIAKDPESVAHTQVLGANQPLSGGENYIIITNFDFYFHDLREYFDPTGWTKSIKIPRRIEAERLLNASKTHTPEELFETINAPGVLADTIFQAIINVEKGIWNVSQPDL